MAQDSNAIYHVVVKMRSDKLAQTTLSNSWALDALGPKLL